MQPITTAPIARTSHNDCPGLVGQYCTAYITAKGRLLVTAWIEQADGREDGASRAYPYCPGCGRAASELADEAARREVAG